MAPDLKWNGEDIENLYLLAVVNRRGIKSVRWVEFRLISLLLLNTRIFCCSCDQLAIIEYDFRDLTANDLPLLENVRDKGLAAIREKYNVRPDQVRLLHLIRSQIKYNHHELKLIFFRCESTSIISRPSSIFTCTLSFYRTMPLPPEYIKSVYQYPDN